jgi:hypothetical protein
MNIVCVSHNALHLMISEAARNNRATMAAAPGGIPQMFRECA